MIRSVEHKSALKLFWNIVINVVFFVEKWQSRFTYLFAYNQAIKHQPLLLQVG